MGKYYGLIILTCSKEVSPSKWLAINIKVILSSTAISCVLITCLLQVPEENSLCLLSLVFIDVHVIISVKDPKILLA